MRLRHLSLKNYRGFASLKLDFHPQFNALIGTNGAGKTSVLRAIKRALQYYFSVLLPGMPEFSPDDVRHVRRSLGDAVRFEPQYPMRIAFTLEVQDREVEMDVVLADDLELQRGYYDAIHTPLADEARTFQRQVHAGAAVILPLLAYYPARRPWELPEKTNWREIMTAKPQRLDGYKNGLTASRSLEMLIEWFSRQQLISLQEGREPTAFRAVKGALLSTFPSARSIVASVRESAIVVEYSDGTSSKLSDLSDGQRNFLALFGDIALRAAQLNDFLGEDALAKTPGIVLIDELDLHLHPRWQREIVRKLRATFPEIQFIIATHSPLIVGELKPEEVIVLAGREHAETPAQSFGMDSNFILREVMGADERDTGIKQALDAIRKMIDDEKYDEALAEIDRTREQLQGSDTELDRAEALVQRIQLVGE